jgi:hypothetical protein
MNILGMLQDGLDSIWQSFGTGTGAVLVPVTYIRITRQPYAPGGRVTVVETSYPIARIALLDYDLEMNPRTDIAVSDKQALIRASDIPFRPAVDDRIIEEDGTEWIVRGLSGDTRIYHDLQLRKR